jgi:hypothetical protein
MRTGKADQKFVEYVCFRVFDLVATAGVIHLFGNNQMGANGFNGGFTPGAELQQSKLTTIH